MAIIYLNLYKNSLFPVTFYFSKKNNYDELLATVTKDELNDIMTQYANPVLAKEGLNL